MAYTTIDKPDDYFNTVLYSGTGSDQSVTGTGFTTDWLWIKERNGTDFHFVNDSVRGKGTNNHYLNIFPNATTAEVDQTTGVNAINSNGFDITYRGELNESGKNYVAWNWLAGGTASSNTDGSITSSVSANTTAGFSIVSYTGTGSAATIGHSLNAVPKVIIFKNRDGTRNWNSYHEPLGTGKRMKLNSTAAEESSTTFIANTTPTSSVISLSTSGDTNNSGDDIIAYCFAEKKGYSKFGSYTGNGNADGTFVYTGFKPAFTILKRTDSADNWLMHDNKRKNEFNPVDTQLFPDLNNAESSSSAILDYCSNGFKIRKTGGNINASGGTYIYMAFAENPFVTSTGIPCTAR